MSADTTAGEVVDRGLRWDVEDTPRMIETTGGDGCRVRSWLMNADNLVTDAAGSGSKHRRMVGIVGIVSGKECHTGVRTFRSA